MPDITSCKFVVNDGDDPRRTFTFSCVQEGDQYKVNIETEGIVEPYGGTVSRRDPEYKILDHPDNRVKATGKLTLSSVPNDPRVIILFTGDLQTRATTSVENVVVASLG
jgi:hypothetical protein